MEDEEMEIEEDSLFYVVEEVDFTYEFDAARFFDFARPETVDETRVAEKWFQTAPCYPPSPFVTQLILREATLMEAVNTSSKPTNVDNTTALPGAHSDDNGLVNEASLRDVNNTDSKGVNRVNFTNFQTGILHKAPNQPMQMNSGLRFKSQPSTHDKPKAKPKSSIKHIPRSSTLMRPTASQLAKQNQPAQVATSRFPTFLAQIDKGSCNHPAFESQAPKRQKLEGGHLHKINDAKQHTELLRKVPIKDGNSMHGRLKITIPREPDLETAQRANRIRPKNSSAPSEHVIPAPRRFKARPLNRKILEAPSLPLSKKSTPKLPDFQEFHLKTLQRATQHSSAVSSFSDACRNFDKGLERPSVFPVLGNENTERRRPYAAGASQLDGNGQIHSFKALPLNKKIFSSKGDMGVFRNIKRETTLPMEFNFHTEKKVQHNLPIDLFSKLSLASDRQPNNGTQMKLPHTSMSTKVSKENRLNYLQPGNEITHSVKEKPPISKPPISGSSFNEGVMGASLKWVNR